MDDFAISAWPRWIVVCLKITSGLELHQSSPNCLKNLTIFLGISLSLENSCHGPTCRGTVYLIQGSYSAVCSPSDYCSCGSWRTNRTLVFSLLSQILRCALEMLVSHNDLSDLSILYQVFYTSFYFIHQFRTVTAESLRSTCRPISPSCCGDRRWKPQPSKAPFLCSFGVSMTWCHLCWDLQCDYKNENKTHISSYFAWKLHVRRTSLAWKGSKSTAIGATFWRSLISQRTPCPTGSRTRAGCGARKLQNLKVFWDVKRKNIKPQTNWMNFNLQSHRFFS